MDYATEVELRRLWAALRCKANCGSGGGGEVVYLTISELLNLISANNIVVGTTYIITNVSGFSQVSVIGESSNSVSGDGNGLMYSPNYSPSGTNLGQLNANNIQTVADGEKVIWGDHYWINNSGGDVTPTITDNKVLASPMTKILKVAGNGYEEYTVAVKVNTTIEFCLTEISWGVNNTKWELPAIIQIGGDTTAYLYSPICNIDIFDSNVTSVFNACYIDNPSYIIDVSTKFSSIYQNNDISVDVSNAPNSLIANNITVKNLAILGSNNEVLENTFLQTVEIQGESNTVANNTDIRQLFISSGNNQVADNNGRINSSFLSSGSRLQNNYIFPNAATVVGNEIGYIELWDNCELNDNELNGDGAVIWDVRAGENGKFNENIVNGDAISNFSGFSDFDFMNFDEVIGNTINGNDSQIEIFDLKGYSKFNNNTLNKDNTKIGRITMLSSEITGCTINQISDCTGWINIDLSNSKIENATDIDIKNCKFSSVNLDLTGFTQDIIGETIENRKGWFTITHNFSANPLNSGSSVLYNIIPEEARVTNIKTFGTATGGAGATLAFGIDTDAPNLLTSAVLATVNAGQTYNLVSTPATANRSLNITAGISNVTGGEVTVLVEFVL